MTLTEEMMMKIDAINAEIGVIKSFIMSRDVVTNKTYCELKKIAKPTLLGWFAKGCPREDSRHVSISAVDGWAKAKNTRALKS